MKTRAKPGSGAAPQRPVTVNRAPVLTLWAAVVARRLGHPWPTALTLGRAVAGLNAYTKGQAIGVYRKRPTKKKLPIVGRRVALMQRSVPVARTQAGVRAIAAGRPIDPAGVERYLRGKFGADYTRVRGAMRKLAQSLPPALLAERAYPLYVRFRPAVAAGRSGWGQRSVLSLKKIAAAARR